MIASRSRRLSRHPGGRRPPRGFNGMIPEIDLHHAAIASRHRSLAQSGRPQYVGPVLVRFSNRPSGSSASLIRPSGSSAFRLSTTAVSMSLTGFALLFGTRPPRPFHHGDSKTRWNNLLGAASPSV